MGNQDIRTGTSYLNQGPHSSYVTKKTKIELIEEKPLHHKI
jgi:hypothetical protein